MATDKHSKYTDIKVSNFLIETRQTDKHSKYADIKVSNFLIETRLDACEYSNETIFLKRKLFGLEVNDTVLMVRSRFVPNMMFGKKLIISFETKRTYKVTTVFVFESNEESLNKFVSHPPTILCYGLFVLSFLRFQTNCPILKRLVLISCFILDVFADFAQTKYCSTFPCLSVIQCVTGMTSQ